MKTQEASDAALLEGMPHNKPRRIIRKKRYVSMKHLPLDVAVRRQVAEEIGEAEPTRDQKYILLQKYGVVAPIIDRLMVKPIWMEESTWKRKLNDWFKMTQGLAAKYQQKSSRASKPWDRQRQERFQKNSRPNNSNKFRPNFAPTKTANTQN